MTDEPIFHAVAEQTGVRPVEQRGAWPAVNRPPPTLILPAVSPTWLRDRTEGWCEDRRPGALTDDDGCE